MVCSVGKNRKIRKDLEYTQSRVFSEVMPEFTFALKINFKNSSL